MSLKIIFILAGAFLSFQGMAYTSDYVSAFKPVKQNQGTIEMADGIRRDVFQIRALMNLRKKKMFGLVNNRGASESKKRAPAEI